MSKAMRPSGMVVLNKGKRVRSTPDSFAPTRFARVRSAPVRSAPDRYAFAGAAMLSLKNKTAAQGGAQEQLFFLCVNLEIR